MNTNVASGVPPPSIVVSSRDFDRLEQLLDGPIRTGQETAILLMRELLRAELAEEGAMPDNVVSMGSLVKCIDESTGKQRELTLVYPHEASVERGRVSILTPVGSALLGLSTGATIDWPAPGGGNLRLRVTDVVRQPELIPAAQ